MANWFDLERIKVGCIDWQLYGTTYNQSYWGKLILDDFGNGAYCSKNGQYMCAIFYPVTADDGTILKVSDLLDGPAPRRSRSADQSSVETIIQLKASGMSIEDIVRLKRENVI